MVRACLLSFLFITGFVVTAIGLQRATPERLKIEWWNTLKNEVDVVFLGSSHFYRQIDPALFDASLESQGLTLRSFNFGVPGMRLPEASYMVDRLLSDSPENLQWILIEAGPWRIDMEPENDGTERQIYWHDTRRTLAMIQHGEQSRLNKEEFSDLCVRHLRHWLQRSFSLGRGPDLWKRWVLGETEVFQNRPGLGKDPERNGFLALDEQADHPNFKNRRREFLSNPNDFQVAKQSLRNAGFQGKVSQELKTQVLEIQERAAHLGVRIVWVLHPGLERDFEFHQLAAEEPSIHLLAFDDPDRYPKLYQKRHHWDMHHLNAQGASIWTEQLAQDWLALAQSLDS